MNSRWKITTSLWIKAPPKLTFPYGVYFCSLPRSLSLASFAKNVFSYFKQVIYLCYDNKWVRFPWVLFFVFMCKFLLSSAYVLDVLLNKGNNKMLVKVPLRSLGHRLNNSQCIFKCWSLDIDLNIKRSRPQQYTAKITKFEGLNSVEILINWLRLDEKESGNRPLS